MIRLTLLLMFFPGSFVLKAQNDSLMYYYNGAKKARSENNASEFYAMIMNAHRLHPYHPNILYQAALASALTGKQEQSIELLKKTIHVNAKADLDHADLVSLNQQPAFISLRKLKSELLEPVVNSDTAFVIPDRTLHLECIAAGETKDVFYAGSINKRKIIRIQDGKARDFVQSAADGLTSVFGIKVDPKKKILWACSSPMEEMENYDTTARSAVFKYDVSNGKLLKKYLPSPYDANGYIFGDLVMTPAGEILISDSKNNRIFRVNEEKGTLDQFFNSEKFWNIQGITSSDDGKKLFISDYIQGIFVLELPDRKLTKLEEQFDLSTKSIDGLTFYRNSLIAIQNFISPMRVMKYTLNDKYQLTGYMIIDKAHPAFNEPTIGCISNGAFYYVANSAWSGYTEDHKLKSNEQLSEPVVLKYVLK